MAKFNSKLSKKEIDKILYQLCLAIAEIKDPNEAAELLRDLLSYQESEMLAKRLKIAEYLINGSIYSEIEEQLLVSSSTIARVQEWLKISGEGYQKAIARTKKKINQNDEKQQDSIDENWGSIKKRFPAYYWPELLLENIVANSTNKQKERIKTVINSLEKSKEKTELYHKLKKLIN
ncbi:MAG: Trp family transcriptional regulator [Candidatus Moraniibacteriota bacterium]